ncbi:cyclase family protein [Anoxynatronum sibiricum]|uniref:Cyclase family protein n=1 Tax=Anoxynatronum sibiricum TaxID=210623 RepID=A0ABU9VTD3_9CLOT
MKWPGTIIDISMEISENMMVYKNREENKPRIQVTRDFTASEAYETTVTLGMHTGTHLDMPLHMIPGGETLNDLRLEQVVTPCQVVDLTEAAGGITQQDLEKKEISSGKFVLLKTRNSFHETFDFEFVYLERSGAAYLKELGVTGVGIDSLGIERDQPDRMTHKTLLGNGILILEGLRLAAVPPGDYLLVAVPLKIKGAEASPVRALLLEP